mmetsp:Transcript_35009/g.80941  ORF Transcript_35009/g.80941 Transcript_35009/m.80941 type:complete len:118 (-) Transcript_35009:106-459(-)
MRTPRPITRLPKENPRISKGGSPALFTPAPPIIADFGAAQPLSSSDIKSAGVEVVLGSWVAEDICLRTNDNCWCGTLNAPTEAKTIAANRTEEISRILTKIKTKTGLSSQISDKIMK